MSRFSGVLRKHVMVGPRSNQPESLNPENAANIKLNCFLIVATVLEND